MKLFRLYVKKGDQWEMACTVEAPDAETGEREAVLLLNPEQRKLPRKLIEGDAPPPKNHQG